MKKLILIAAAALVALAGCKQVKSSQEALDEFNAAYAELMEAYRADAQAVDEDESLTDEQKEARWEELQDATIAQMTATGKDFLKKYGKDTLVAPTVIGHIYAYLNDDELDGVLASVSPELKESNKLIASIAEDLAYRKSTAVGSQFVDFTVDHVAGVDKDGNPIYEKKNLSDFVGKGKVMLVDFWSPWCPPCKAEIPNIKAVWEKYHGDDFDVLSVAVWEESRKMDWHNTIDTAAFYGMKWQQLNNGHKEPATLYGISGIPHMILFDKDGTILKRGDDLRGAATEKAVAEVLGR